MKSSNKLLWEVHTSKLTQYLQIVESKSSVKIRCGKCNLPFLSKEQLKRHAATHKRRETFDCSHWQKGFVRGEPLHERTCEKKPERKNKVGKYSAVMQVGSGVDNALNLLESALDGV